MTNINVDKLKSNLALYNVSLEDYNTNFANLIGKFVIPPIFKKINKEITEEESFYQIATSIFTAIDNLISQKASIIMSENNSYEKWEAIVSKYRANNFKLAIYEEIKYRLLSGTFPEFANMQHISTNSVSINGNKKDYSVLEQTLSNIPSVLIYNSNWDDLETNPDLMKINLEKAIDEPVKKNISNLVNEYFNENINLFKGEKGDKPTPEDIKEAAEKFLRENEALFKGEQGEPGKQGIPGLPGEKPTTEELTESISKFMSENIEKFKGQKGEPGNGMNPEQIRDLAAAKRFATQAHDNMNQLVQSLTDKQNKLSSTNNQFKTIKVNENGEIEYSDLPTLPKVDLTPINKEMGLIKNELDSKANKSKIEDEIQKLKNEISQLKNNRQSLSIKKIRFRTVKNDSNSYSGTTNNITIEELDKIWNSQILSVKMIDHKYKQNSQYEVESTAIWFPEKDYRTKKKEWMHFWILNNEKRAVKYQKSTTGEIIIQIQDKNKIRRDAWDFEFEFAIIE